MANHSVTRYIDAHSDILGVARGPDRNNRVVRATE